MYSPKSIKALIPKFMAFTGEIFGIGLGFNDVMGDGTGALISV